ncbi:MAG TPA: DUF1786 domain-containing protein, partial [Thermodesulfobacteriota bacterium]|nr:DUF1786 domain-containing protein [Thermodesulfobacteriota bacterium]
TQDLLAWNPGEAMENAVQCVLPSPTIMVARKIRQATLEGKTIFLTGTVMGGGPSSRAIRDHLKAGLAVYAQTRPAQTLQDNLDYIRQMGVRLDEPPPAEALPVFMADIQEKSLLTFFEAFGLPLPQSRLVAVQDHGFSPRESNRRFRFRQWEAFLESGKPLETLLYRRIPNHLTRMQAIQEIWPRALVMDTGAAAILGALEDEEVKPLSAAPLLIVNIGNEHTLAAWWVDGRVQGIYEHHTGLLNPEKLLDHLAAFAAGRLTNEQILEDMGHGCLNKNPAQNLSYPVVVTGPRRSMLHRNSVIMAAPYGNMMLSGCFGLLQAYRKTYPDSSK